MLKKNNMPTLEFYAGHFERMAEGLQFDAKTHRATQSKFEFFLTNPDTGVSSAQLERWADSLIAHRDKARELGIKAKLYRDLADQFRADIELSKSK